MKRFFRYIMIMVIGMLACACMFDDLELKEQLGDIKDRIETNREPFGYMPPQGMKSHLRACIQYIPAY